MASRHSCIKCKKARDGRFTRSGGGATGTWSPGGMLPAWWCYKCLPEGEGRGEKKEEPMTVKASSSVVVQTKPRAYAKEQGEVSAVIVTLSTEVEELEVTTPEQYEYADQLLGRVNKARGMWAAIWDRIQERSIKPIREGLEEFYVLNREIDGPSEKLVKAIKDKMKAFKVAEQRRIDAEEREKQLAAQKLLDEAKAKEEALAKAKTPMMRERLRTASEQLQQQAETVLMQESSLPTVGVSSGIRKRKVARITNLEAFIGFMLDGELTAHQLRYEVHLAMCDVVKTHTKDADIDQIPGVTVEDDIDIIGRR